MTDRVKGERDGVCIVIGYRECRCLTTSLTTIFHHKIVCKHHISTAIIDLFRKSAEGLPSAGDKSYFVSVLGKRLSRGGTRASSVANACNNEQFTRSSGRLCFGVMLSPMSTGLEVTMLDG